MSLHYPLKELSTPVNQIMNPSWGFPHPCDINPLIITMSAEKSHRLVNLPIRMAHLSNQDLQQGLTLAILYTTNQWRRNSLPTILW